MSDAKPRARSLVERFPALGRLRRGQRRIPVVEQLAQTECGPACLAMVLGYHGKVIGREELRDILSTGRDGSSAADILKAARYYGLRGRGVKLEIEGLRFLPEASILHWEFNHFVVFERLRSNGVDIVDPAFGRRFIPLEDFGKAFTGVALILEPSETFQPGNSRRRGGDLGEVLRESGQWTRILTMSFFLQALTLTLPLLTGAVVDRVVPRGDRHMLLVLSIGLLFVVLFQLLASIIRAHLLLQMRTLVDARMTLDFIEHLIALPYAFFQRRTRGDILMRLNSNVLIRQTLTSGALSGMLDGALMLGYLVLVFVASASFGLLVIAFSLLQVGVMLATGRRRKEVNAATIVKQTAAQDYQVEMLAGMETLKAMGAETRAQEHWTNLFVDVLNATLVEGRLTAAVDSVSSTLRLAAPLAILAFGALAVVNGEMSLGTMLAVNTFAVGVFTPLSNLVSTGVQLQLIGTYLDRIADVRGTPVEQDLSKVRPAPVLKGGITLEHVSFRYGPLDPLVVNDVSVKVDPGQFVAIVGRSGSGKSTLASLLLGLHAPTAGRILYDEIPLSDLDLRSVRHQLGIVTQRAYLFSNSIRANIALSEPSLPMKEIIAAAKLAHIHEEISQLPMNYDTLLTDSGGSVSGGQRQRIALARALVRKPAILLLDEATSALDAITERAVQVELERLRCTRIVIAHRLSTVLRADRILVMDTGKLVEQGTHQELLEAGGIYAELVHSQLDSPASAR